MKNKKSPRDAVSEAPQGGDERAEDRKISDDVLMGATVQSLMKVLHGKSPQIAIRALAVTAATVVYQSAPNDEARRHNRIQLDRGIEVMLQACAELDTRTKQNLAVLRVPTKGATMPVPGNQIIKPS